MNWRLILCNKWNHHRGISQSSVLLGKRVLSSSRKLSFLQNKVNILTNSNTTPTDDDIIYHDTLSISGNRRRLISSSNSRQSNINTTSNRKNHHTNKNIDLNNYKDFITSFLACPVGAADKFMIGNAFDVLKVFPNYMVKTYDSKRVKNKNNSKKADLARDMEYLLQAEAVLRRIVSEKTNKESHQNIRIRVQTLQINKLLDAYATVIKSFAAQGQSKEAEDALNRMESLYHYLVQHSEALDETFPSIISTNILLKGFASCISPPSSKQEKNQKRYYKKVYNSNSSSEATIQFVTKRVQELLDATESRNVMSYNTVMNAFANAGSISSAKSVESLLDQMIQSHKPAPTEVSWNIAFKAWSNVVRPLKHELNPAIEAERLLSKLENCRNYTVTTTHLNSIMSIWCSRVQYDHLALSKIEGYLGVMVDNWNQNALGAYDKEIEVLPLGPYPDTISFGLAIKALIQASASTQKQDKRLENALKGYDILRKMIDIRLASHNMNIKSPVVLQSSNFNKILEMLNACARNGSKVAAEKANDLVTLMKGLAMDKIDDISPDNYTFGLLTNTLVNRNVSFNHDVASNAEAVLLQMEEQYKAGNSDNPPSTLDYNSVLKAWSKSRSPKRNERIEALLSRMNNSAYVLPDIISYTLAINALEGKDAEKAEDYLDEAKSKELSSDGIVSFRIDEKFYNSIIRVWLESKDDRYHKKAEHLLFNMENELKAGNSNLEWDIFPYFLLIKSYSLRKYPLKAEQTFRRMQELSKNGIQNLKPDKYSVNALLNAFAVANQSRKSFSVLMDFLADHENGKNRGANFRPDVIHFTTVLKACRNSRNNIEEDVDIALQTLGKLRCSRYGPADSIVYKMMFQVLHKIPRSNPAREEKLKSVLANCCSDGQLSDEVLSTLKDVSTNLHNEIMSTIEQQKELFAKYRINVK